MHALRGFVAVVGLMLAFSLDAQTILPEPIFANRFESGLIGLSPNLNYVVEGGSGVATAPTPLTLSISDASVFDTFYPVSSDDPGRLEIVGGGVTMPSGQTQAVILVNALVAGGVPVRVSATEGNSMAAGVRIERALNETDAVDEADFCALQFPQSFSVLSGQLAGPVFGQLYEDGITDPPGAPSGWIGQVGYGPSGSDPRLLADWYFFDAAYNTQIGNNDEFQASFVSPRTSGVYGYVYRFSNDGGGSWTYCDIDGAGSNPGVDFNPGMLGQMTVTPATVGLVINEVDYDQVDADFNEFVEIYNGSGNVLDLAGLAVVLVNGSNSLEYARIDLSTAGSIAPGQYLVIAAPSVTVAAGALRINFASPDNNIQNGAPDGVALIDTVAVELIDALSYEGSINAASINGFPTPVDLVEGTATTAVDINATSGSLVRLPNGIDTNDADTDWQFTVVVTPGEANL